MPGENELMEQVAALMRSVGQCELLPRLQDASATARLKAPGEVVTEADLAAEAVLSRGLLALLPDSVVIGEEAADADPSLLDAIERHDYAWVVDPLDGTQHFAAGEGPFGIMIALLRSGRCDAAWIYLPLTDELATARRGAGAWLDGRLVSIPPKPTHSPPTGRILTRFFPEPLKAHAEAAQGSARTQALHQCSARSYVDHLRGDEQFTAYWRTLPWDHAPGVLLVEEAGGHARRFDGSPFEPSDVTATGLLVASDRRTWAHVHAKFLTAPT